MAKKLSFDYTVHRGAEKDFTLPAKLDDGSEVAAVVPGFEAELVPDDGVQGTLRVSFPGGDEDAETMLEEGKKVTVTIAPQ